MWFELKGDERLKRCATEGCFGQQAWRLEAGGIGSNYCSGCKAMLEKSPMRRHPWDQNEHGLWCSVCGNHIAAPWHLEDEDYTPPETCKQCGFPDEIDPEAI